MNAIVEISGKQYNVGKNTKLFVDKLQEKEGSKITFDNVLMAVSYTHLTLPTTPYV